MHKLAFLTALLLNSACGPAELDTTKAGEDCTNGVDDDDNGETDCGDPACADSVACAEEEEEEEGGDGPIYINEFMASNTHTLQDSTDAYPDWIELYNGGAEDTSLEGWTITDSVDEPDKHVLGDITVKAGDFLVLFADGDVDQGDRHLPYDLDREGEEIALFSPDGTRVDWVTFDEQQADISAARMPDGSDNWGYPDEATPGESNGQ